MPTGPVTLTESASRGLVELGRTVEEVAQAKTVELRLPAGTHPVKPDEVMIVVVGSQGAIVGTRKLLRRPVKPREFWLWLASAEAAIIELGGASISQAPPLSATEASLLDEARFSAGDQEQPSALERSRIELELLVQRESLSLEQAAKALGVSAARLRQRLSPTKRTLYGVKDERAWRIPKFQFEKKDKIVRGIDKVFPRVRPDAHPLAVKRWFTMPHQDLVVDDDEEPVTPLAWLAAGQPPEVVAELAGEI
jgi:hypothetical protein